MYVSLGISNTPASRHFRFETVYNMAFRFSASKPRFAVCCACSNGIWAFTERRGMLRRGRVPGREQHARWRRVLWSRNGRLRCLSHVELCSLAACMKHPVCSPTCCSWLGCGWPTSIRDSLGCGFRSGTKRLLPTVALWTPAHLGPLLNKSTRSAGAVLLT